MPEFKRTRSAPLLAVLLVVLSSPTFASGIDTAENVGNLPINVEGVMGMTLVNRSGAVYVGVGTSVPYMPLTIHTGPDQNLGVISAAGWGVSGIALESYKDDLSSAEPLLLQASTIYLQATGGDISIGTSASPTAAISVNGNMNVTGNVGIGTTAMQGAFVVVSNNPYSTGGGVRFQATANGTEYEMLLNSSSSGYSSIQSYQETKGVAPLLLQGLGGDVGLGSTDPIGSLDIESTTSPGNATLCLNGSCTKTLPTTQLYACPVNLTSGGGSWASYGCIGQVSTYSTCSNYWFSGGVQHWTTSCTPFN